MSGKTRVRAPCAAQESAITADSLGRVASRLQSDPALMMEYAGRRTALHLLNQFRVVCEMLHDDAASYAGCVQDSQYL